MKSILVFVLTMIITVGPAMATEPNNCISCHQDLEEEDGPSHVFSRDIHSQRGLGCQDCHGGDPTLEDMDEVRASGDYRGAPGHLEVPDFCARCHSSAAYMHEHNPSLAVDQMAKYRTSIHGQKLFGEKDTKVANCISCHSAHEIAGEQLPYSSVHPLNLPATCGKCHADEGYMAEYGIPTDQLSSYRESVHGRALLERKDLGAPACNDCHGNHAAAPPGVASLAAVCGMCHAMEAQLFEASPHAEAYDENEVTMCDTFHASHPDNKQHEHKVRSSDASLCTNCHEHYDATPDPTTPDFA